jgi:hypothetical protein
MDLTGKLFDLLQRKNESAKIENIRPPSPEAATPPPANPAEEDDPLKGIAERLAECDRRVASTTKGATAEEVNQALAEMIVVDLGQVAREIGLLTMSWTFATIRGPMCAGYANCARCGDAIAPVGTTSRVEVMDCGSCKAPISVWLLEYSPAVGRQILHTLKLHKSSVQQLQLARALHEKQQDQEAAEIAEREAEAFGKRGHRIAQGQALLYAHGYFRSFAITRARQCAEQALSIFLERKSVSGVIRSLYHLAVEEWRHDENVARALVWLAQDLSRTHEPEYEGLAFHARSLFLEAAFAVGRVMTCMETEAALRAAHRFLVDVANRPHCSKLLSLKIEEQFSYVRQKMSGLTADVPDLLKRAEVARDAKDEDASNLVMRDLLPVAIQLGDFAALKDICNQLMLDCFKRQDLAGVLDHLSTMEVVCRELKDKKSLSIVLQNRSVLLEAVDEQTEAQKLKVEYEKIASEIKNIEERLVNEKSAASSAVEKEVWAEALPLWWKVRENSAALSDLDGQFEALLQIQVCESRLGQHLPRMLTLLELEGRAFSSAETLAAVLVEQARTWEALGDLAAAGGRLARAALSFNELLLQQPETSADRQTAAQRRDVCLSDLRQIGDKFASEGDLAGAERMYSVLVDAGKQCLQKIYGDAFLRLNVICNLDELGFTIAQTVDRESEGRKLMHEALAMLDALDADEPSGADGRAMVRADILAHLG